MDSTTEICTVCKTTASIVTATGIETRLKALQKCFVCALMVHDPEYKAANGRRSKCSHHNGFFTVTVLAMITMTQYDNIPCLCLQLQDQRSNALRA